MYIIGFVEIPIIQFDYSTDTLHKRFLEIFLTSLEPQLG